MAGRLQIGFHVNPTGRLLEQIVELDAPMGLAYERSVGFHKDWHVHDRLMIVCPRSASRMAISLEQTSETFVIDSTEVLLVPPGWRHDDQALSVVYDTLALFPSKSYVEAMLGENGLGADDEPRLLGRAHRLKRTAWLDELIGRYFFERILNPASPADCPYFLEKQILNELVRLVFSEKVRTFGKPLGEGDGRGAERALAYIETNLFAELSLEILATDCRVSRNTLLRAFRDAFGYSPMEFVRLRRLDEANRLLKTGDYLVSDLSLLVGYEDVSAFSKAYKKRFGKSPVADTKQP